MAIRHFKIIASEGLSIKYLMVVEMLFLKGLKTNKIGVNPE